MTACVVDASFLVAGLTDAGSVGEDARDRLGVVRPHAPAVVGFEVANVLRRLERAGLVARVEAAQAHADLLDLPIEQWPHALVAGRVWELRDNLGAYDAAYVAVAELIGAPLLTLDRRLGAASGPRCEVVVLGREPSG